MVVLSGAADVFIVIAFAAIAGGIAIKLRQSLMVAYLLSGAILGSGIISFAGITFLSEASQARLSGLVFNLSLAFIFFMVGLELRVSRALEHRRALVWGIPLVALIVGLIGYAIVRAFGVDHRDSILLGTAIAFSSTMMVTGHLSSPDQKRTPALRLAVGWLLIEDLLAVFILAIVASVVGVAGTSALLPILEAAGLGLLSSITFILGSLLLLIISYGLGKFVLPRLYRLVLANAELQVLLAVSTVIFLGFIAAALGLSVAVGALVAGLLLANTGEPHSSYAAIRSLAVLFGALFFATLGFSLALLTVRSFGIALILSVVVLLLKPILSIAIMRLWKIAPADAISTGLTLGSISEIGIIIVALAHRAGFISVDALVIVLTAAVITYVVSSQLMRFLPLLAYTIETRFTSVKKESVRKVRNALESAPNLTLSHTTPEKTGRNECVLVLAQNQSMQTYSNSRVVHTNIVSLFAALNKAVPQVRHIAIDLPGVYLPPLVKVLRARAKHAEIVVLVEHQSEIPALQRAGASKTVNYSLLNDSRVSPILSRKASAIQSRIVRTSADGRALDIDEFFRRLTRTELSRARATLLPTRKQSVGSKSRGDIE